MMRAGGGDGKPRQASVLGSLIGFEPGHFQNGAERVEAVAPGDLGKFGGERGYIVCGGSRRFLSILAVGVVPVRHYLFTTRFFGALPRWQAR